MGKKLIIANWKMNPSSEREAERMLRAAAASAQRHRHIRIVVAPPFPYLSCARRQHSRAAIQLAAQDVFWEEGGAYTGEVSPTMLKKLGVSHVILGHSERREHLGETNTMINRKVRAVLKAGLSVILCVGEKERSPDGNIFSDFVKTELIEGLVGVGRNMLPGLIIAYEPIWAVGAGKKADSPDNFFAMTIFIRRTLLDVMGSRAVNALPIIYGGSVTAKNAAGFFAAEGASGVLVGRASLDAKEFAAIIEAAEKAKIQ